MTYGRSLRLNRRTFAQLALASAASTLLIPESRANPARGGLLRQALSDGGTSDTLDGARISNTHQVSTSWQIRNCLFEVLPNGEVAGELVESWTAEPGAKRWVLKLRRGVEFHDGKTLDSQDVVSSINYHRGENSTSAAKTVVAGIENVRADDKETVIIDLHGGNADLPYLLADWHLLIVPDGKTGLRDWEGGNGTGPFILEEWSPGVISRVRRNPNYFKSGLPYFDAVENYVIVDVAARVNALMSGEVDVVENPDLNAAALLKRTPGVKLMETPSTRHFTLPMKTDVKPFDDINVRTALKLAINREELLAKVLRGYGTLGNDHPIAASQKYYAGDLPQRTYDPEQAKFLLKKSGYDDLTLELVVAEILIGATNLAVLYKEQAKQANININIKQLPNDGYLTNIWLTVPWCVSFWAGRPTVDWMFTIGYESGAAWNDTRWANPHFDELLRTARAELDESKRATIYRELQSMTRDEGGALIPLFTTLLAASTEKVQTPELRSGMYGLDGGRNAERWWFSS